MRNARFPLLLIAALALVALGAALMPAVQSGIVRHLLRRALDPALEIGSARIGWGGDVRVRELRWRTPALDRKSVV